MAVLLLASCVEPSPLFGTWADNKGSTLIFFTDDTFNAKILSSGTTKNYEGSYTVLLNSLTMNCTELGLRVVTEWDIRGNILYINWVTEDGDSLSLSLFKIAN
jgi:hypothetical protein